MTPSGRFAPSPSGDLHIGNLRTAVLAYVYARIADYGFILRMEDLDERSRPEFVSRQIADLTQLGLHWQEPVIFQHERVDIYADFATRLVREGLLYECYCTRKDLTSVVTAPHRPPGAYPGTCRELSSYQREQGREKLVALGRRPALRLRTEVVEKTIIDDRYGSYTGVVDDIVIQRGDGVYSYNFVSVIDDATTGVQQVVRGDDLLSSTPRQVYLQEVLNLPTPRYLHVPLVCNNHGKRLAKRDGAVTREALAEYGWTTRDIIRLIAASLGIPEACTVDEIYTQHQNIQFHNGAYMLDPNRLLQGPDWYFTQLDSDSYSS